MKATWFVVLSQSSMKLFFRDRESKSLQHIKTFRNSLVNVRGRDLVRHQAGKMPKGGKGSRRSKLDSGIRPHDLVVEGFTRKMARYLDGERKKDHFQNLKIAAEPKVLGLVRKAMPDETIKTVRLWVLKDLEKADDSQLKKAFAV